MMDVLQSYMVRIFAGGILCAAAMIVAGDGAKKEIVRLCCACLMIVFVLTPIQGAGFSLDTLLDDREAVKAQIEGALSTVQASQLEAVRGELTAHIQALADQADIEATITVSCHLDGQKSLVIDRVEVLHRGGGPQALAGLKARIMADFGLEESGISVKEAAGS